MADAWDQFPAVGALQSDPWEAFPRADAQTEAPVDPSEGSVPDFNRQPNYKGRTGDFLKPYFGGRNPVADVTDLVAPALDVSSDRGIGERVQDTVNFAASVPFRAARLPSPGEMIESATGLSGARESEQRFVENNPAVMKVLGAAGEIAPGLTPVPVPQPRVPSRATPAPRAPSARDALIKDAQDIGVDLPVAAAGGPGARATGAAMAELPFVGSRMQRAARKAYGQLETARDRVVRDLGDVGPVAAGEGVRDGIMSWIKGDAEAINRAAYSAVDRLIKPSTTVPLENTAKAARELSRRDVVSASADGQQVIKLVMEAIERPGGLTYEGIKELRTRIGGRISGDVAGHGVSEKALKGLYAALSDDLAVVVRKAGTAKSRSSGRRALAAFEAANKTAKQVFAKQEQLKKIIGADGKASGEAVVDRMMAMGNSKRGGDIRRLAHAKSVVGKDAWNGLASAIIKRMGETKDGMSIAQFRTAYEGTLSEAARSAFFGKKGTPHRDALDKIARAGQHAEMLQRAGNHSGSARHAITAGAAFVALSHPYIVAGAALGNFAIAEILSRPATARATASWMQRYNAYARNATAQNRAYAEAAARTLAAKVASDRAEQQEIAAKLNEALSGPQSESPAPVSRPAATVPAAN